MVIDDISNGVIGMYGLDKKFHKDAMKYAKDNAAGVIESFLSQKDLGWDAWFDKNADDILGNY